MMVDANLFDLTTKTDVRQGLSQDLKTECPKLANVKSLEIFQGRP